MTGAGERAAAMLAQAAEISAPGPGVTRLPFTEEHRAANDLIAGWMRAAGLAVHLDAAGTLIGRREGPPGASTLLLGSHQDSVREGGAFDGMMGVVLPILALQALGDAPLPFAVEVLAFADEEGVRFPTALLGPRALAGTVPAGAMAMTDRDGVRLGDALRAFGGDPDALPALCRDPGTILGYVEAHIEQGPLLEDEDLLVGIVTAIAGIERHAVTIEGRAGHAGTTPMRLRHDALAVAAETVLATEREAAAAQDVLGTVGQIDIAPNVVNAVPGRARLTVEVRSADDLRREAVAGRIALAADCAARARGCTLSMERTYAQPAQACDAGLQEALARAVAAAGHRPLRLLSGATHDASAMADLCAMAMLFVRCRGGVSHHPDEHATAADMGAAVATFAALLRDLAAQDAAL